MPFVERDTNGSVKGVYACLQEGYAEELLADDAAEVVAFLNPPEQLPALEPFQFYSVLELSGHKAALDAYIDALPNPQKVIAKNKLKLSKSFHRDNPLVLAAQSALELTDEQLDALWQQAAAIS